MPRIKSVHIKDCCRFTDLSIEGIPPDTRLVVMLGPNGSGKTSVFQAFVIWHSSPFQPPPAQYGKQGQPEVTLDFHGDRDCKPLFYFRSAHRNEPVLAAPQYQVSMGMVNLALTEGRVGHNVRTILDTALNTVFGPDQPNLSQVAIRDTVLGRLAKSFSAVMGSQLRLAGLFNTPAQVPQLRFSKGVSLEYDYSCLSGGEKAAFDILLDVIANEQSFEQKIVCIDEPELHMHTELQSALMQEIYTHIPETTQLWISTHSLGIIKKALDLHHSFPGQVVFLDFHNRDFDLPQVMKPAPVDRNLWKSAFTVALHDIAELVSPSTIVICEGKVKPMTGTKFDKKAAVENAEFDAKVYAKIFGPYHPDTDFVASGACNDIIHDSSKIQSALATLLPGVTVIKIVDRDCERSSSETHEIIDEGFRILSTRDIENYLWDDEVLEKLCRFSGHDDKIESILNLKRAALNKQPGQSIEPCDDVKAVRGELIPKIKKLLDLKEAGTKPEAFAIDTLAPLITPDSNIYRALEKDIFGANVGARKSTASL